MLFIKDKASGEQKLWINSINGLEKLEDGDRLRFATVNDKSLTFSGDYTFGNYGNAKNGIMLMNNGVLNNAFIIDSEKYSGCAFGLGLDRMVMMTMGFNDIRDLNSGNLKIFKQFKVEK